MALSATVALSSGQLTQPDIWDIHVELHNDGPGAVRLSTATMLGAVSFEVVEGK